MRLDYKFTLHVEMPDGQMMACAFPVDALMAEKVAHWKPMDRCSSPLVALIAGGATPEMAQRIDKDREALARDVSNKLTECILDAIQSRDLSNGYAQEKSR